MSASTLLLRSLRSQDKRVAKLQAEEAAKRAAKQAEEEERRKQDREARLAAAAQYQEADWITASEAARAQEVRKGAGPDRRKVGGSGKLGQPAAEGMTASTVCSVQGLVCQVASLDASGGFLIGLSVCAAG